jgi:hypothetical protein
MKRIADVWIWRLMAAKHKSARFRKRPLHGLAALKREPRRVKFERLQFSVGVRADFAVEVDFFVLRCGPFHEWLLKIGT